MLTIKPRSGYGTTASYTLDAATNTFVASTAPTTTATTTDSTTTTTTIDPAETEEALRKIFEEYVDEKKKELPYTTAIDSFYYDESAKKHMVYILVKIVLIYLYYALLQKTVL